MRRTVPLVLAALVVGAIACSRFERFLDGQRVLDTPSHGQFQDFLVEEDLAGTFADFEAHLQAAGVAEVVPPWTLWRQGTDWRSVEQPPFAVPPRDTWDAMVPTLRVVRDDVVPVVGPVEVVSAWRTETYNAVAGGSAGSRHKWFEAVDLQPRRSWERSALHDRLLELWRTRGPKVRMGLGLYDFTRFHVDTHRHRRW